MFFGAGNLIFPLLIGKSVGENVWFALLGLTLTAVIVPFLGLATMVLFQADYDRFFGRMGKIPGLFLLFFLQLIMGPLGVIPRLVTLMHAMSGPYLNNMSLILFSIFTAAIIFLCNVKQKKLIDLLGIILTPILLLSLAALIFIGLLDGSSINPQFLSAKESFLQGLLGGYNTMDLIGAFLFATVVLPHFQKKEKVELEKFMQNRKSLLKKMFFPSFIAASLLLLSYIGLGLISAHHGRTLDSSYPPEQMLGAIAMKILGPLGGCLAAIVATVACLTTAITLTSIFAEYLRKDLCKEKISRTLALVLTLLVITLFANIGYGGIAAFLSPILQIIYPGLILFTVLNLFHCLYGYDRVKIPLFITFICSVSVYFFSKL